MAARCSIPRSTPTYWLIYTAKLPTSLSMLGRGDSKQLSLQATPRRVSPSKAACKLAYATAMLYTRHLQTERRDDERALGWINTAIAIASLIADPKERALQTVFNHNGLALIEAHRGRPQRALEPHHRAGDAQPAPRAHRAPAPPLVLRYNRAQVLASLGRVEEALQEYRTVLEWDPNYPEYHFDVGNLLRRLGREDEALAEYETAMRLSPPFPEAFYNRADILAAAGDFDAALRDYDYVLELNPEYVDALLNRAAILADLERPAEAGRDVEAGLALEPRNAHLLSLGARLALESGDLAAARAVISDALAADPALPQAWALSGAIEFEAGNATGAIDHLSRSLELQPDTDVLFNRASARQAAGQWSLAVEDFDAVLALAPEEAQAWLRRAQCRAARGGPRRRQPTTLRGASHWIPTAQPTSPTSCRSTCLSAPEPHSGAAGPHQPGGLAGGLADPHADRLQRVLLGLRRCRPSRTRSRRRGPSSCPRAR